jgi:putative oxidoreductase
MQLGRFVARTLIGSLFIGHGTQKLFGWFEGPGLAGTQGFVESLDLRPSRPNALAAGITETTGGALLVAGLGTPLAASGLIGTMITAIRKVHRPNGPWSQNGGWEYNAVLIGVLLALAEEGPGDFSLDHKLGFKDPGPLWALGALAAGAAASTAVIEVGRRAAARPASQPEASAPLDTSAEPQIEAQPDLTATPEAQLTPETQVPGSARRPS